MGAERDARWLLQRLREEEDLRPPYRLQREQRWVMEATVLRDEDGSPTAYTELRKHLFAVELTTVVVDPHHRGKGLSHALVEAAVQSTTARPLILFTRSAALERAVAEQVSCNAGSGIHSRCRRLDFVLRCDAGGCCCSVTCGNCGLKSPTWRPFDAGCSTMERRRESFLFRPRHRQTAQAGLQAKRVQGRSEAFHVVR